MTIHPTISRKTQQGRCGDPAASVQAIYGSVAFAEETITLDMVQRISDKTPAAAIQTWEAAFASAAQHVELDILPAYDVLPPAIQVMVKLPHTPPRLIRAFALSHGVAGEHRARIAATACALQQVSRLTASGAVPAVSHATP